VVHLDGILFETEQVREERAAFMLHHLIIAPWAGVDNGRSPEDTLLYRFLHPAVAFATSHFISPFEPVKF